MISVLLKGKKLITQVLIIVFLSSVAVLNISRIRNSIFESKKSTGEVEQNSETFQLAKCNCSRTLFFQVLPEPSFSTLATMRPRACLPTQLERSTCKLEVSVLPRPLSLGTWRRWLPSVVRELAVEVSSSTVPFHKESSHHTLV